MHSTRSVASCRRLALIGLAWLLVGAVAPVQAAKPIATTPVPAASAARVQLSEAWVRPAVKGQSGTGGFMRLLSPVAVTLVGVSSPVATMAELHQMKMEGDVMRMRPLPALALPAGQAIELKPGGNHLMLMGLTKALAAGDHVPLTLRFKTADGHEFTQLEQVPVRVPARAASQGQAHDHGHGHDMGSGH